MARIAKYTQALPVYVTPRVRARLDGLAERHKVSLAEVVRDLIDHGLDEAEARWDTAFSSDTP